MKIWGPQQSKERTQSKLVILFILFPFLCSPSLTKYFCFFNFSSCSNKVLITCFFFEIAFFATGQPIQNIPIICQIDCCKNHSYFKSSACINIATKMIYPSNCNPSQMAGILGWFESFAKKIGSCNKEQKKKHMTLGQSRLVWGAETALISLNIETQKSNGKFDQKSRFLQISISRTQEEIPATMIHQNHPHT